MQFASALSTHAETAQAIGTVCQEIRERLPHPPDVAVMFVSHDHVASFDNLSRDICERLGTDNLIGCTGESIVGVGREVENEPAISLWAGCLPGVKVDLIHLTLERTPEGPTFLGWPDGLDEPWPTGASLIVLGEPYTFPADFLLERLNQDQPQIPVSGGMASGGSEPGENRLWLGRSTLQVGAVAMRFTGDIRMRTLVSQGCRPIGHHFVITKVDRNVILELGGKPALEQLQEVFATLSTTEQRMVQQGLHLGRVVSEYQDHFEQGDFLVRNVIGISREHGAIAVGDFMRVGQTVQFHIRDAETADAELQQLLAIDRVSAAPPPRGGLLFTCNGRGSRLFGTPNHDAGLIQSALGSFPLAGLFAAGELGPIARRNFMHGFTASLALFHEPDRTNS